MITRILKDVINSIEERKYFMLTFYLIVTILVILFWDRILTIIIYIIAFRLMAFMFSIMPIRRRW